MTQQSDTPEYFNASIARLERERDEAMWQNQTFRNAQKACEDCDAPTMEEVKQLRKVADELAHELHGFSSINTVLEIYKDLPHVIARKETQ